MGIDPGSRTCGWGVVRRERGRFVRVASGAIRTKSETPMAIRLREIHDGLRDAMRLHGPDAVAIEAIFAHKSAASALVLGQARGVAMLAAAEAALPLFEYNASTIKKSVTGSGKAEKSQVGFMVMRMLGITLDGPADEADALAIAVTHHAHAGMHAAIAAAAETAASVGRAKPVAAGAATTWDATNTAGASTEVAPGPRRARVPA